MMDMVAMKVFHMMETGEMWLLFGLKIKKKGITGSK